MELIQSPHAAELKLAVRLAKKAGNNMRGYIETKGTSEAANYSLDIDTKSNAADFCTKSIPLYKFERNRRAVLGW